MTRRLLGIIPLVLVLYAALYTAGCVAAEKSSNPLSSSVAGPLPGVGISAPRMAQPSNGVQIPADQQPVTLTVGNSASTGVRPLSYRFEVAADAAFSSLALSQEGVTPDPSGQTSIRLTDALPSGRTYYWRARAEDGANSSDYSATYRFAIFVPTLLQAPVPVSPINNVTVSSLRPAVTFLNAARSGPPVTILYRIEASNSAAFTSVVGASVVEGSDGQTTYVPGEDLPNGQQVYWRVRAYINDPPQTGPWSGTQTFRTPAVSTGGGGTPAANDQLDLRSVTILKGPAAISSWPVGSTITSVSQGNGQLCINHTELGIWPATNFIYDPVPGATLVEGNQWIFANIGGKWYGGAGDWYRPGQACKGVDAASIGRDSFFGQEPLASWVPQPGELFGVMSTTPARVWPDMKTLDQRTNTVLLRWQ